MSKTWLLGMGRTDRSQPDERQHEEEMIDVPYVRSTLGNFRVHVTIDVSESEA